MCVCKCCIVVVVVFFIIVVVVVATGVSVGQLLLL